MSLARPKVGSLTKKLFGLLPAIRMILVSPPPTGKVGAHTLDQLTTEPQAQNVDDQMCLTMFMLAIPLTRWTFGWPAPAGKYFL